MLSETQTREAFGNALPKSATKEIQDMTQVLVSIFLDSVSAEVAAGTPSVLYADSK
jgi:hypothetical protein